MTKLFLETHVQREPYTIAVPVQATQEIEMIANGHNVQIKRIRSSHGGMMEATRDSQVLFVGGTRGGFIFPEFLSASDGMFTACKLLEMVAATGYTLSDLDRTLPKRHLLQQSVPCAWESKGTVMRRAMEHSENKQRLLVDGVKILDGTVSILLVPDREEATFTVTAEADTADKAQRELDRYTTLVAQWRDGN